MFRKKMIHSTHNFYVLYCFILSIFIASVTLGMQTAAAATYYVSPAGASAWSQCTDIALPCSPGTAMTNASAGDIVYFRGGTYEVGESPPYHAYYEPSNSGQPGNPIYFGAYPGEIPLFNVTVTTKGGDFAIGIVNQNYITLDGFHVQANNGVNMGGITANGNGIAGRIVGAIVKNSILNGGTTVITLDDNASPFRIEQTDGALIQNNKIFNCRAAANVGRDNVSGIKFYHNSNAIVENNEIYNTTTAFSSKSDTDDSIFRYNYIHDNERGMFFATYAPNNSSDRNKVYDNILVNNSDIAFFQYSDTDGSFHADDWQVYNNTIYGTGASAGITYGLGTNWKFWNNIIQTSKNDRFVSLRNAQLSESDHNQFGSSPLLVRTRVYAGGNNYTSLSAWQNSGELMGGGNPGVGSLASDSKFVNASGNMNQLDDFKLAGDSPSKGAGRSGGDIGANISIVGYKGNGIVRAVPRPPTLSVQ